jgi:hypothetical protein
MCRFKDGQDVTADAHIKISRDSQSLENYYLTVTLVKGEDAGNYEAHAENSMGTAITKSTVKVNSEYTYRFFLLQFSVVMFCCHIIFQIWIYFTQLYLLRCVQNFQMILSVLLYLMAT